MSNKEILELKKLISMEEIVRSAGLGNLLPEEIEAGVNCVRNYAFEDLKHGCEVLHRFNHQNNYIGHEHLPAIYSVAGSLELFLIPGSTRHRISGPAVIHYEIDELTGKRKISKEKWCRHGLPYLPAMHELMEWSEYCKAKDVIPMSYDQETISKLNDI